ncbi:MAG: FMN-binding protein [Gemmatimonadales bacterium]
MQSVCAVRGAPCAGRFRTAVSPARPTARPPVRLLGALGALLALALASTAANAQGVTSQQAALEMAVSGAEWERRTAYLSDADLAVIAGRAGPGVEVDDAVVSYYVARVAGETVSIVYFDAHYVRTLQEVIMVAVRPDGLVRRVEVLKFMEPPEYRAPGGWLEQFHGARLDDALSLKGDIVAMTGATLTSEAVTGAVRRMLAYHGFLQPLAEPTRGANP